MDYMPKKPFYLTGLSNIRFYRHFSVLMGDFHIRDHLRVDRVNSVDFCQ